uniref:Methyltransf_11 domain-containing protein n=2 Tax=Caenorhabditis tropicalis TaxID=1561998 RepID=A0A1I7UX25_9PELO
MSMHPEYPDFENLDILEVSCGQGYSLEWIENWHGPIKCLIGCDKVVTRNVNNIVYGDAHKLPFADESFDFILNVEAAHLYSDYQKFFQECYRVLRTGGVFCYLDIRYPRDVSLLNDAAKSLGFVTKHLELCTEEVVEGLNHSARKYDELLEKAPWFVKMFKNTLRATYCAPGTEAYERLRTEQKIYLAVMWMKC